MKITVKILNAFSAFGSGGNPAGVVLSADELTLAQKQEIASKVGVPETAFVSNSLIAGYKLDFFTPERQIPHCGHATIATFSYLRQMGLIAGNQSSKETIDGVRKIFFEGDQAYMEQTAPVYPSFSQSQLQSSLSALGLTVSDLAEPSQPIVVNTGNSFMIVEVKSAEILRDIVPDQQAIRQISIELNLIGFYVFHRDADNQQVDATTRMFAPYYGINEEAATGMAAGPLACLLYKNGIKKPVINIVQGQFMDPPSVSLLHANLEMDDSGQIARLYVGGLAYLSSEKTIEI